MLADPEFQPSKVALPGVRLANATAVCLGLISWIVGNPYITRG